MTSLPCPSLSDLFAPARTPQVETHLASCVRCRSLLRAQAEGIGGTTDDTDSVALFARDGDALGSATAVGLPSGTRPAAPESAEPGTIVLIETPGSDLLLPAVFVRESDEAVTVIPLSDQVSYAAEWDMLVARDVLGYETMAEAWNHGRVLPEQIHEPLLQLASEHWSLLQALLRAVVADGERPEGVEVGPAVVGSGDPRLRFQDEESERVRAYWQPSLILAGAATLGQLVSHRRREFGIPVEELERLSLQPGWLAALEQDELDIPRALPSSTLTDLMLRLGIGASNRLRRLAVTTIEAFGGAGEIGQGVAYARRRADSRTSAAEESAEEYVSRFLDDLSSRQP